ncbi:MAG: hypothetical protein ABI216_15735 [Devosia sp.]
MTLRADLYIQQNASWSHVHTHNDAAGSPIDLTGYTAAMSIKRAPGQTVVARAYLSSGGDADGGTIVMGGAAGTITMSMTPAQTLKLLWDFDLWAVIESRDPDAALVKPQNTLVYDCSITNTNGVTTRVLEGRAIVRRSVTP